MHKAFQNGARLSLILSVAALLSGCVLPEKFDADITMHGYAYDVALRGRLAEARVVGMLAKGKTIPPKAEERLKAEADKALKMPGMTKFAYSGEGRFDFEMQADGVLTDTATTLGFPNTKGKSNNFLTIQRQEDGAVVISTPEVPEKALAELNASGLKATGTVHIQVDGKVLESNADEQSSDGDFVWKRTTWADRVYLKFDPNSR